MKHFVGGSATRFKCSSIISKLPSYLCQKSGSRLCMSDGSKQMHYYNNIRLESTKTKEFSTTTSNYLKSNPINNFNSNLNNGISRKLSDYITIVRDEETAHKVLEVLYQNPESTVWACDTEVADIDVKTQGPVGNGKVTCISIYGGPHIDFGRGVGGVLWIENLGDAEGILNLFKDWFENENYKKVWHNYGFDRHVMFNENINCLGFKADTMHMARLWDTGRDKLSGGEGYSLEGLTSSLLKNPMFNKISMKDLFGVARQKKDGSDSKIKEIPEIRELQTSSQFREKWIEYSSRDAVATWHIYDELVKKLKYIPWVIDNKKLGNMFEYYEMYLKGILYSFEF